MPLITGQRLGAYEIVCSLGAGGMGEVYRARDSRLGRDVALKILPPEVVSEAGRLERFDREARAIAALNHPHIVTIYSTEDSDGIRFLTMELVEGCTLSDLIAPSGMPIPRFLDLALPLSDALAAAHQKQITHRDLKPGNVMVSTDGRVKVLDFGLARVGGAEAAEQTLIATQAPITHQGVIVGTMPYMSPEQVEGRGLDPRTDLFSLGVIFYELLSGQRPFKGSSSPALMSAILRDTPPPLAEWRSDIPDALERLIARLIEKRAEDRIQTARDVFNELKHIRKRLDSSLARTNAVVDAATPHNLSVAVLPFTVRGSDPDAESMAAGLTEDITTSLAKFAGLSVIATQATRAYQGTALDIRQIADRLAARYVVSGNVRKSGSTLRTTAQLIDARNGEQLWTENYDRQLGDLFAVQDDVTDHIVATVADKYGVLARSMVQALQSGSLRDSTAVQLIVHTWGFQHRPVPDVHLALRAELESRVTQTPDNAHLWAELANIYVVEHSLWFNPLPDPLGRAQHAARRAIELDRFNQNGWLWLAITYFHLHERDAFEEARDRAVRMNPRNAYALAWMGNITTHLGDYDRGCALTERSMAINPGHPGWLHFAVFNRHFAAGQYEAALQAARRVNMRDFFWMYFAMASAAAHLGRAQEARSAAHEMTRLAPFLAEPDNLREFVTRWYWPQPMIEALIDGVRQSWAGAAPQLQVSPASLTSAVGVKPPSSMPGKASRSANTSSEQSIAVLPFVDLSEKRDQGWFCDGIAEELLNALAPLPGLRVAARASAFSFRGKHADLRTIADRLNVETVLEGSVRRAGDRVRITAQLSEAKGGRQLWSERFDRELKDIFDVQDEIARAIVDRLRVSLTGRAMPLVPRATANIEAYELLLKGRALLIRRGRAVMDAIPLFERAIELDPNLSEAHALLGDAFRVLALYGLAPASEVMPKANAATARALAIDPFQAEALATQAIIATIHEWNLDEMRRRSDRALAADPDHLRAHVERAISIACLAPGDDWHGEVLHYIGRARALDPINAWVMAIEGAVLTRLATPAEGVAAARRAIDTDGGNFSAHWFYTNALAEAGRDDEAFDAATPALELSGRHALILTILAGLHARRGNTEQIEAIRRELRARSEHTYVSSGAHATVAAALGDWNGAREWLARAIEERDAYVCFWKFFAWRPVWRDRTCAELLLRTPIFRNADSTLKPGAPALPG